MGAVCLARQNCSSVFALGGQSLVSRERDEARPDKRRRNREYSRILPRERCPRVGVCLDGLRQRLSVWRFSRRSWTLVRVVERLRKKQAQGGATGAIRFAVASVHDLSPSIIVGDYYSGYTSTFHGFYSPLRIAYSLATNYPYDATVGSGLLAVAWADGRREKEFCSRGLVSEAIVTILARRPAENQPMLWFRGTR